MVAAVQPNAKRLVAYTSVAHLGFAVLGIFALNLQGIQGALVLMIAHGVSTPMLFFLLGMLYERTHSYEIEDFGGLAASIPMLDDRSRARRPSFAAYAKRTSALVPWPPRRARLTFRRT